MIENGCIQSTYMYTDCNYNCLQPYADSNDPDQPAHPRSLIRVIAVRKQNHLILYNILTESKWPGDT